MVHRPPRHRPGLRRRLARHAGLLLHLAGALLALALAGLAAAWLTRACAGMTAAACDIPVQQGDRLLLLVPAVAGLGLLLTRRHAPARRVYLTVAVLLSGLLLLRPLLPAAATPALTPAVLLSLLLLSLLTGPLRQAEQALAVVQGRRAWWATALRAARLTRRTLGAGAYRQLCATGHIRVASTLYPGRHYLVPRRTSPSGARVLVEEHGRVIGGLCLRPREPLPDPEEVVAHVLLLRGDERAYLAAANFFPYDTVLTPQATARRLRT